MNPRSRRVAGLVALAGACLVTAAAATADREVRIFTNSDGVTTRYVTGDHVPPGAIITILFRSEPCPLALADAPRMRRAWQMLGGYQVGCWYPTIDGGFVIFDGIGEAHHEPLWEALPRALLHTDGSATIVEKNYDSRTFLAQISQKKLAETMSRTQQKP